MRMRQGLWRKMSTEAKMADSFDEMQVEVS